VFVTGVDELVVTGVDKLVGSAIAGNGAAAGTARDATLAARGPVAAACARLWPLVVRTDPGVRTSLYPPSGIGTRNELGTGARVGGGGVLCASHTTRTLAWPATGRDKYWVAREDIEGAGLEYVMPGNAAGMAGAETLGVAAANLLAAASGWVPG
jgi:hypothetical protein